ncbi:MAG: cysteine desulfurase [Micavibrio sp.]|nr:cysteine desulfurase [Micavibrio sp.]
MPLKTRTYLDANATMPLKPGVISAIAATLAETGNASSMHGDGRLARKRVEDARAAVADLLSTNPAYVFFTGGATESNNTVINSFRGKKIFISAIEHPSVLEAAPDAQKIPVTADGVIDMDKLETMLAGQPDLISVMLVNNETGTIQPIAEIVRLVRKISPQTRIHTDAVQALGRIPVDFSALQVDYLSLSAHKFGGPQGIGALVLAPGAKIEKLLRGGGQEKRQRAGTENIAAIAGLGEAARLAVTDMENFQSLAALRDRLEATLEKAEPRLRIFGAGAPRVSNTTQIALPGIQAETQLMALDLAGMSVSSGSACSSGSVKVSHVLEAMQVPESEALGAIRVSLAWNTTQNDIDLFTAAWLEMHGRIKARIAA